MRVQPQTSPPALFHVTNSDIDTPSWFAARDYLQSRGESDGKHPNGILGLWVSEQPESYRSVGSHLFELTLRSDFQPVVMDYGQLSRFNRDMRRQSLNYREELDAYTRLREQLIHCGDVLFCEDANGMAEVVILNYDAISSFQLRPDYAWRPGQIAPFQIPKDWRNLIGTHMARRITLESATPEPTAKPARRPRP